MVAAESGQYPSTSRGVVVPLALTPGAIRTGSPDDEGSSTTDDATPGATGEVGRPHKPLLTAAASAGLPPVTGARPRQLEGAGSFQGTEEEGGGTSDGCHAEPPPSTCVGSISGESPLPIGLVGDSHASGCASAILKPSEPLGSEGTESTESSRFATTSDWCLTHGRSRPVEMARLAELHSRECR